jgi:hypothetical protein
MVNVHHHFTHLVDSFQNLLDDRLQHANSGIVMSTAKLFLKLTENIPNVYKQVIAQLKAPLLTLLDSSTPELCATCLNHIAILSYRSPGLFEQEYHYFFVK